MEKIEIKWKMTIENIKVSKLLLFDKNPRRISKHQMDKLCRSIESDPDYLQCRPVLVNCVSMEIPNGNVTQMYHVYAGNQRVRAAKKLGLKEIPCIVSNDLPDDVIKSRTIKDNAHCGEWDFDELANCFDVEMLVECGFNEEELVGSLKNLEDKTKDLKGSEKKEKRCPNCDFVL